ncbi:MAG: hypothetical protein Q8K70_02690 [Bacteroidota bacterium]|nr:hypothetical protein [Bacteroidota bacterium]
MNNFKINAITFLILIGISACKKNKQENPKPNIKEDLTLIYSCQLNEFDHIYPIYSGKYGMYNYRFAFNVLEKGSIIPVIKLFKLENSEFASSIIGEKISQMYFYPFSQFRTYDDGYLRIDDIYEERDNFLYLRENELMYSSYTNDTISISEATYFKDKMKYQPNYDIKNITRKQNVKKIEFENVFNCHLLYDNDKSYFIYSKPSDYLQISNNSFLHFQVEQNGKIIKKDSILTDKATRMRGNSMESWIEGSRFTPIKRKNNQTPLYLIGNNWFFLDIDNGFKFTSFKIPKFTFPEYKYGCSQMSNYFYYKENLYASVYFRYDGNKVSFAGLCKLENSEFKEIEFDKSNVEGVFGNEHEIMVAKRVSNVIVDFLRLNIE